MIGWHNLAVAAFSVAGVACVGIGAISLLASGTIDNGTAADRAGSQGFILGSLGLVLILAAFVVRAL